MKIGVSSYSFSKYIKQYGCDIFSVCDKAKELGFDGIEFTTLETYAKEGEDLISLAVRIKEHCEKVGLEIINYAVTANLLAEDVAFEVKRVEKHVDIAAALGSPLMRHDLCIMKNEPRYTWQNALQDILPYVIEITEYAEQKGVKTCTENHGYTFQSPERVESLVRAVNHNNFSWLCDIGNFLVADCDPAKAVALATPYTVHVHVKDFLFKSGDVDCPKGFFTTVDGNHIRGTVVGHGVVPVKNCISVLKKSGYDGYVSIEFEGMEEVIPALKAGLDFLKKII